VGSIEIMPQVPKRMWHENIMVTQGTFFFVFRITASNGLLVEVEKKLKPSYLKKKSIAYGDIF
jgi:hypothetical protein